MIAAPASRRERPGGPSGALGTAPATRRGRAARPFTLAMVLGPAAGLLAVLIITGFFFSRSIGLEAAQHLAENDAIARGAAAFIEAREESYLNVLLAYAGRFRFREAVKRQDRAAALVHLRQLNESFPELDRPVLADPAGVVWAIYPESPEVYGRSFAYRDWYRGVSREWRPYMSEVFQAAASDRSLVVALAVPIRDQDGRLIGIIASAQRLELIRRWLLPIHVPGGHLYVVDRNGRFVFHPTRTGPEHLADYARLPVVERVLRGEEGTAEMDNPVEREVRLSAYRPLRSLGWGLVVQRSKNQALERTRTLVLVSGTAGLLLSLAVVGAGAAAVRSHRETLAALAALGEKSRALEDAQEELVRTERLATLGQLAGGVGHELRNPLGVIKNSVYYLRIVLPEDEKVARHLGILEREVASANRIVSDLLDFARIKTPNRVATDLSVLAQQSLDRTLVPGDIQVALALAADLSPVSVDPEQVGQVLQNLVANALQAMPEGGTLTIETLPVDGGAQVAVADTGVGILPEHLAKIFQPLFTTKTKGIGLGLAVAKNLAEANGGSIAVESVPGRGSRFAVRFPAPDAAV